MNISWSLRSRILIALGTIVTVIAANYLLAIYTERSATTVFNAESFGFAPGNNASDNTIALQKALDGGRKTVLVKARGEYLIDRTLYIDDQTTLRFSEGVTIKKVGSFVNVLVNRGALTGKWNRDITIDGVHLINNNVRAKQSPGDTLYGLTGQVSFWRVRNGRILNSKCLDIEPSQFFIQAVAFENLLIENFEARGKKDAIHLGAGRNFIIRRGVTQTLDDSIALNAQDYAEAQPELGSIYDGLIENITDERSGYQSGYTARLLTGAWIDWHEGIRLRNGDTVQNGTNLYRVVVDSRDAILRKEEYRSNTPPTHTAGVWSDPNQRMLKFLHIPSAQGHRVDIKNVRFRNIKSYARTGIGIFWDNSIYNRGVHPEVNPGNLPVTEVTVENFAHETLYTLPLMSGNASATVLLDQVLSNGPLFVFSAKDFPIGVDLTIRHTTFELGDKPEAVVDIQAGTGASGRITLENNTVHRPIRIGAAPEMKVEYR